jgi:hypothetical protein
VTGFLAALVKGRPHVWMVVIHAEPAADGVTLTTHIEQLSTRQPDRAVFISSQHPDVIARARERLGKVRRASVHELVDAATELVTLDIALDAQRSAGARKSGPPIALATLDRDGLRFVTPGLCQAPSAP